MSGLVSATITIDSATPLNNSAYFSVESITASITASDSNSFPLNYTYRVRPSIWYDEDNYTIVLGGGSFTNGYDEDNRNQLSAAGSGATSTATRVIHFDKDEWSIYLYASDTGCTVRQRITINGTQIYTNDGDLAKTLTTFDVSKYNSGGGGYEVQFIADDGCGAADGSERFTEWWFPEYHANSTSDLGSPVSSRSIIRQNSSTSTYILNKTELNFLGHPYTWNATVYNNETETINTSNRLITFVDYTNCSSNYNYTTNIFRIRDEETSVLTNGEIQTSITLSGVDTSNADQETYGFSYSGGNTYYACMRPYNYKVYANNFLTYTADYTDYTTTRAYYFSDTVFNSSNAESFDLYVINDSLATTVITTVKRGGSVLEDAIVKLLRYDVSNTSSRTVQICRTSSTGSCALFAELNTELYQLVIIVDGETALTTTPAQITSSTLNINLPTTGVDPTREFRSIEGVSYLLSYNNNTGFFTCTFNDDDNTEITVTLEAERIDSRGVTSIDTDTITSTAGTLTTNVSLINGTTYRGTCTATFSDGSTGVLDIITITVPFGQGVLGALGWIIFSLTTIAFSFTFIFNPTIALVLNAVNIYMSKAMGLINIDWTVVIGLIAVLLLIGVYSRLDRR